MSAQRLAYTTDLTDEEWQILEPLLPPERTGGRLRQYPCGRCSMAFSLCCAAVALGG
jgi:transposase